MYKPASEVSNLTPGILKSGWRRTLVIKILSNLPILVFSEKSLWFGTVLEIWNHGKTTMLRTIFARDKAHKLFYQSV